MCPVYLFFRCTFFFRIAGVLWVVAIVFIVYKSLDDLTPPTGAQPDHGRLRVVGDFALGALADFGTVGIAITMLSMILTRIVNHMGGFLMTFYQAMVNRFVSRQQHPSAPRAVV